MKKLPESWMEYLIDRDNASKGDGFIFYATEGYSYIPRDVFENNLETVPEHYAHPLAKKQIEKHLKDVLWYSLQNNSPKLYSRLLMSIWRFPYIQKVIEDVEHELMTKNITLGMLVSIQELDESNLASSLLTFSTESEKQLKIIRKHFKKAKKPLEEILNGQYPSSLKKACQIVLQNMDTFLKVYTEDIQSLCNEYRQETQRKHEKLAGKHVGLHPNIYSKVFRKKSILKTRMKALVSELKAAGFSDRKSYILTDKIIHSFFPVYWPKPTTESYKKIRLLLAYRQS